MAIISRVFKTNNLKMPAPFDYPGTIAQLGEHLPYKQGVTGSSPVGPTI